MTNQNIFIDIETAPLDEDYIRSIAPDFKAPKTYKKEEAIEEYKLGKLAEYIAEGALKAQTGRVIAFGFAIGERSPCVNVAEKPADEKRILRDFWSLITDEHGVISKRVIGFNNIDFDIPFLIQRSWLNNVKVPEAVFSAYGRKYYLNDMFKDVMLRWACGTNKFVSLAQLSKFLGVGGKTESGENFHRMLVEDYQKALDYLINDVELTRSCAERLGMVL